MIEGLYIATFGTGRDEGTGVVFAKHGELHGGDDQMFYVGSYKSEGSSVTGQLHVKMYNKIAGRGSVFGPGVDEFSLDIAGSVTGSGESANLTGSIAGAPQHKLHVKLFRVAA